MNMRMRKLVGTVVLFVVITAYTLLAMAVAVALELNTTSKYIEPVFYTVAGLLWVLPAMWIIRWMSKDDAAS